MKLISMTDFVLEQVELYKEDKIGVFDFALRVKKYANFITRPLKLEMFIPCVDNKLFNYSIHGNKEQYEKAKEKVLFKGFESKGGLAVAKAICTTYQKIEELTYKKVPLVDLELTESAIKQLEI